MMLILIWDRILSVERVEENKTPIPKCHTMSIYVLFNIEQKIKQAKKRI